eukprot:CAMPEP_0194203894 /NCGR_PEP_ID=MMETSP0156-20130528/3546_1 /TAXON_ID=33649 /ORGANISM="Thalassionema nitzschioides, Strain L26-B" /LENGTH=344 /DNA_ID=CAMNT_0038929747 /DNA_START=320 /DNA_END=1354 /DNA_ORIENTATION=-
MKRSHDSTASPLDDDHGGKSSHKKMTATPTTTFQDVVLVDDEAALWHHIHGFLHWKEAIVLSSVDWALFKEYEKHCGVILKPLLTCLNSLVRSDLHEHCGKVYAPLSKRECDCDRTPKDWESCAKDQPLAHLDPRYKQEYDSWSDHEKCAAMLRFVSHVVSNLRPHLQMKWKDAANPIKTANAIGTIEGSWSFGVGHRGNALIGLYPRRTTLAYNLALVRNALGTLASGDNYNYESAVAKGGDINPGGSSWGVSICETVESMLPLSDDKLVDFIEELLPSRQTRDLLGSSLVHRLLLTAPLLSWLDEDNQDEDIIVLPRRMDRFHQADAHQVMEEWDPMDGGVW